METFYPSGISHRRRGIPTNIRCLTAQLAACKGAAHLFRNSKQKLFYYFISVNFLMLRSFQFDGKRFWLLAFSFSLFIAELFIHVFCLLSFMHRKKFIQLISATAAMSTLGSLKSFADTLKNQEEKMPLLFVGHGSPMNGIEDNEFSRRWEQMGREIPQPRAVLCISAHWLTNGTAVTAMQQPQTIHDFGGFPQELFDVQYPAPGDPALAAETASLVHKTQVGLDHEWGLTMARGAL
jgi:hypothetical protein